VAASVSKIFASDRQTDGQTTQQLPHQAGQLAALGDSSAATLSVLNVLIRTQLRSVLAYLLQSHGSSKYRAHAQCITWCYKIRVSVVLNVGSGVWKDDGKRVQGSSRGDHRACDSREKQRTAESGRSKAPPTASDYLPARHSSCHPQRTGRQAGHTASHRHVITPSS